MPDRRSSFYIVGEMQLKMLSLEVVLAPKNQVKNRLMVYLITSEFSHFHIMYRPIVFTNKSLNSLSRLFNAV